MTPHGAEGPLPMIVCVHGGPTWNWGAYFSDSEPNAVLLASAGYACLLPNPRGSIGRGHAFAQGVIGDGGGIDYRDIMAGVDHCIAEGIADPDRLGIAGLSYGGYMAGWAVGQTDRFGASVAMSVVSNYVSFHLTSEVWWYDQAILEGEWNDPTSQYVERSPVTHAHRCTTPTLIIQGAEDRCTPVGPGRGALPRDRGLRRRGRARRVPARGTRAGGAGARARRDPADAGLVRPPPLNARDRLRLGHECATFVHAHGVDRERRIARHRDRPRLAGARTDHRRGPLLPRPRIRRADECRRCSSIDRERCLPVAARTIEPQARTEGPALQGFEGHREGRVLRERRDAASEGIHVGNRRDAPAEDRERVEFEIVVRHLELSLHARRTIALAIGGGDPEGPRSSHRERCRGSSFPRPCRSTRSPTRRNRGLASPSA